MPVIFVIDPEAPAELVTATLSYTFFEVEGRRTTSANSVTNVAR